MRTRGFWAIATLVPGLFLMQSSGTMAVAVVDFDRAVASMPEGKEAMTKLKTFGDEQTTAIQKKVKEANDLEDRLRSQQRVLSAEARDQMTRELDTARTAVETMQAEAQKKFSEMQTQLLGPVEQKTAAAVSAYAAERGVKIVFDASRLGDALVYAHDTADITTEIIRRIAANQDKPGRTLDASERFQQQLQHRKFIDPGFLKGAVTPALTAPAQVERNARGN